jgi:multiple sugar transport system substrate-binding protein
MTWVGVCLLALSASSCSVLATPIPTPVSEPVTITFAYEGLRGTGTAYYELLVQKFNEQYPHITVELRPWDWRPSGQGGFVGPDYEADVNVVYSDDAVYSMLPLNPLIEQDMSFDLADFFPTAIDLFTSEDTVWAIPVGLDVGVVYYDQGLFDEGGVSYPELGWTWDDFLSKALDLSDPEAGIFGYGANRPSLNVSGINDSLWFIYARGGRLVDDLQDPTCTTFDDPLTVEAVEWYADLIHEYNVAPTPEQARGAYGASSSGAPVGSVDLGFLYGKVGMLMGRFSEQGGIWYFSGGEWLRPWGMVTVPSGVQASAPAWGEGLAISGATEHPEACWQWIVFLSEQMPARTIPARKSLVESDEFEQAVGIEIADVARASVEDMVPIHPAYYQIRELYQETIDAIVSGDVAPRQALEGAQQVAEEYTD